MMWHMYIGCCLVGLFVTPLSITRQLTHTTTQLGVVWWGIHRPFLVCVCVCVCACGCVCVCVDTRCGVHVCAYAYAHTQALYAKTILLLNTNHIILWMILV
jgi:hypothetical protein